MKFPLGFNDISLWLAIIAIIILSTSELSSPKYGQIGLVIEKDRLRMVALILGIIFLCTAAIRIYDMILKL